jgi:antitoxin component YwqK of YwqJK toxin-antitoxin module
MAMDIMVHQAPLRNNLLLFLLFCFACFSCINNTPIVSKLEPVHHFNKKVNKEHAIGFKIINGILMEANSPFTGILFTLYPNTIDTAEIASYFNGKEDGEWKKFYPSKKIREKRFFKDGYKTGKFLAWWENGNMQMQYFFEDDEYEGVCKEWSEKGMLNKIMTYKKGHEEGHQQWWYDNGKIKANYVIIDGRRYGLLGTKNCVNVADSIFKN